MPIKVPLSWLREYVEIPVPPEELATRLTLSGIEVEKVHVLGAAWDKVVVGQIVTLDRHTNADRLGVVVLEIDVSPSLGRIMSMVGLAREVAALCGGAVRYPDTSWQADGPPADSLIAVEIDDPDLCSRYSAAVIRGVQIGPAPEWI